MGGRTPDEQRILEQWQRDLASNDEVEKGRAAFGFPPQRGRVSPRRPARPRPLLSSLPEPLSGELAKVLLAHPPMRDGVLYPQGVEWANAYAMRWANALFPVDEVSAWLDAGVGAEEVALAWELRSVGLTPDLLRKPIRRDTVMDRVRSGMSLQWIMDMLRREGHVRESA